MLAETKPLYLRMERFRFLGTARQYYQNTSTASTAIIPSTNGPDSGLAPLAFRFFGTSVPFHFGR
jgi:hypothetical protein